jgi:hypothetical protein
MPTLDNTGPARFEEIRGEVHYAIRRLSTARHEHGLYRSVDVSMDGGRRTRSIMSTGRYVTMIR